MRSPMSKRSHYRRTLIADDAGSDVPEMPGIAYENELKVLITSTIRRRVEEPSNFYVNYVMLIIYEVMAAHQFFLRVIG